MSIENPTWKCLNCGSICDSEVSVVPAPCDHCGSDNIVRYDEAPADAPADKVFQGDLVE